MNSSGTRRVNLVINPVTSHEWGKDREVFTSGTYPCSFVTQIFHNGQPSHLSWSNAVLQLLMVKWCYNECVVMESMYLILLFFSMCYKRHIIIFYMSLTILIPPLCALNWKWNIFDPIWLDSLSFIVQLISTSDEIVFKICIPRADLNFKWLASLFLFHVKLYWNYLKQSWIILFKT